ncbi:MAG: hypothetical protein ABSH19_08690 [Opitutales bacterium]
MSSTLHAIPHHRAHQPRSHSRTHETLPPEDDELRALKRELAAAKERFLQLAQDAERARRAATDLETQARARLNAAAEVLQRARFEPDGPPLNAAVEGALSAIRSLAASLPPVSTPAN